VRPWQRSPGIEEAFTYGSWAAGYAEQPGHVPNDLDLFVVGEVDRRVLDDALHSAEKALRREINVRRTTRATWDADDGSLKAHRDLPASHPPDRRH
jgi:hypothetical protein